MRVLGIEQFDIAHHQGLSHGLTRIIRLAYFESKGLLPLLRQAYTLWESLQKEADEQLLWKTGSIDAGWPTGRTVSGVLGGMRGFALPHGETFDVQSLGRRVSGVRA